MAHGCQQCVPVALEFQTINGKLHCRHCGREVKDELELYILGSPHLRVAPTRPNNSFERGIRRDERGLPYLDASGQPLRMGEGFDPRKYGKSPLSIL